MIAPESASLVSMAALVRKREMTSRELTQACLARIAARPSLNAFIAVLEARALADAAQCDEEIAAGRYRGPLHGIPIALKDLIDVAGSVTTSGSAVPARVAPEDAPVVRRLRDAGAVIIGKTNLHEFAFGTTSEESAYGPVRNPHDQTRSAGGSSGGSAAALVAGMCLGALGTDTGGSVRIPSAACGTVGLKPSLGEISTDGVVPLSTTLDHVGPMARSVADVAVMFAAMAESPAAAAAGRGLRFGVPQRYFCDRVDADVRRALERACAGLRAAGHTVSDVDIAQAEITPDVYLHIVLPEASWYHGPLLDSHASRYSPGVRVRLEMGRYILAEDYVRAMHLRTRLTVEVDRALSGLDALLLPAQPTAAPPLGATTVEIGDAHEPVRAAMLRLTQLFNVTGHPALALPGERGADGLPRGLQLVGHRANTTELLAIGLAVESQISGGPGSVGGGTG
jgi:aspartyl-tRNA(Asn)/glutamyl-tRNA(Gln) amidotransferase subunit A